MKFTYDPRKSSTNKDKHGITFEEAKLLWSVPAVQLAAKAVGEARYIPITPQNAISNNHLASNLKSFSIGKSSQYWEYCYGFPQSKLFNFSQPECYNLAS
jgi:hypothetical protein